MAASAQTRVQARLGRLELETSIFVACSTREAWAVVTDYDRLGRFIPNFESRLAGRTARGILVRQTGISSLSRSLRFQFVLELIRESPQTLRFRQVAGSLRRYAGTWSVTPATRGVIIAYRASMVHGLPLTGRLLESLVRADIEKIMPAIAAEIRRRALPRARTA